jgi:uncharacterized RDD family membrane protein YckC
MSFGLWLLVRFEAMSGATVYGLSFGLFEFLFGLGMLATYLAYAISLERSRRRATLGKLIFGLRVGTCDGSRLSAWHLLLRNGLKVLAFLVLLMLAGPITRGLFGESLSVPRADTISRADYWFVSMLLVYFYVLLRLGDGRRGLHDLAVGTVVVKRFETGPATAVPSHT